MEIDLIDLSEAAGKEEATNRKEGNKIYSVNEVTSYINNLMLNDNNLRDIWVKGEISNFKHHNGIHMYFSLKDDASLIECAMFQDSNRNLNFKPEDGIKVIVRGHLEVYKPRGKYELIVSEIHLEGKGELYFKFLQLKEKLQKEGLFDEKHKKHLPKYPETIGVVTSLSGAVIHDIAKIIKRRYPHVKIIIYPSYVQGNEAKVTLTRGIEVLNSLLVDVIILARGGGSFEELWPFNEEIVARTIYTSVVPVISAIGHESDFTISDFVADKRASTPSAAAEMVVPNEEEIINSINNSEKNIYNGIKNILNKRKSEINQIISRPIFRKPQILIELHKQNLDENTIELKREFTNKIELQKNELLNYDGKLKALSPFSVLNRGYSITMKNDNILSSITNINKEEVITTIVKDGGIKSKVQSKDERKDI